MDNLYNSFDPSGGLYFTTRKLNQSLTGTQNGKLTTPLLILFAIVFSLLSEQALAAYCDASGSNTYQYIMGVEVSSISNIPTGNSIYADYTSLSTAMMPEVGYPITVTRGNPWSNEFDKCGLWIDWNQDEDFYDFNEEIPMSLGVDPCTFTGTITPPAGAALGNTRMRVRIVWNETPLPCGSSNYGEVEDYTIIIPGKYDGGSGTVGDPYLIRTAEQMNAIGANPDDWDKHFKLVADIDLSAFTGTAFNIIGTSDLDSFTGTFDGNDHTISNFIYDSNGVSYIGLFGYIDDSNAELKDLVLINPDVDAGTGDYVGSLVGLNYGTISNCYVEASSVTGGGAVGGLVGLNRGIIDGCHSHCDVIGQGSVGGLVGTNMKLISNCDSNSIVTATGIGIGIGIGIGGLVGRNLSQGIIKESYSTGIVSGQTDVGGLVGGNEWAYIYGCYSTADTFGSVNTGGLVGNNYDAGRINDSYSKGRVDGDESVGGLAGKIYYGDVIRCYSTGRVWAGSKLGGLIGYNIHSNIVSSFWDVQTSFRSNMCGSQGTGAIGCDNTKGKMTVEMQDPNTFTDAGWDFVGEYINGPSDIWAEPNGGGYPTLCWQLDPLPHLPSFSGGKGEANDPYLMSTPGDLNRIGYNPRLMDKHFTLIDDIDLENNDFWIVGNLIHPFEGVFDGNNHKISNFNWVTEDPCLIGLIQYYFDFGLFRYVGDAVISNVSLGDVNIDAGKHSNYVGALVGRNSRGRINNCSITGTISGKRFVGGLIGENKGIIINCSGQANVIGTGDLIGGLVGANSKGDIYSRNTAGSVSGVWRVGGLAGSNGSDGTVSNSFSTVNVKGGDRSGGLVGDNSHRGSLSNCYSTGTIQGKDLVGGLVGKNYDESTVSKCYSTANVKGGDSVGGLVGVNSYGSSISGCYSTGTVDGNNLVGGLVGRNYICSVSCSYAAAMVNGISIVGGFIGSHDSTDYTSCFWDISVNPLLTGIGDGNDTDVIGKSTENMQKKSTFSYAGWDFLNIWDICEGTNYPRFIWQIPIGDLICPDGVNFADFSFFARHWQEGNCGASNDCEGTDLDQLGTVDTNDLGIFVDNWLAGL